MNNGVLFSASELTSLARCLYEESTGVAWAYQIDSLIQRLIDEYNARGTDYLLDEIMTGLDTSCEVLSIADQLEETFRWFIKANLREGYVAVLDYQPQADAIIINYSKKVLTAKKVVLDQLKQEYQNAQEQSDYYPESLRRSFERIMAVQECL